MEEFIINIVGETWAIIAIPVFVGIIASFVIKAIDLATPDKMVAPLITLAICVILGIASAFFFPLIVAGWRDIIMVSLMNVAFAFVFYHLGGKHLVEFIIGKSVEKIKSKVK